MIDELEYPEMFKYSNNSKFVPKISFTYGALESLLLEDLDILEKNLDLLRQYMQKVTGYMWSNSNFLVTDIFGESFTFLLYSGVLHLWNSIGSTKIIDMNFNKPIEERHKEFNIMNHAMENYSRGIVCCSDCGKEVFKDSVKNNKFYAGIYCDECWNREWKVRESKENYD